MNLKVLGFFTLALIGSGRVEAESSHDAVASLKKYQWLEDVGAVPVKNWVAEQNAKTRAYLDTDSLAAALKTRSAELAPKNPGSRTIIGERAFFIRSGSLVQTALDGSSEKVLVDVNALTPRGTAAVVDFALSPDQTKIAYGVAVGGSDRQEWRVRKLDDLTDIPNLVISLRIRGVTWALDGGGLFYTAWPSAEEEMRGQRFNHIYLRHLTGEDQRLFSHRETAKKGIMAQEVESGKKLLAFVNNGADESFRLWLGTKGKARYQWKQIFRTEKQSSTFVGWSPEESFVRTSSCGNNFCLKAVSHKAPHKTRVVVPQNENVLISAQKIGSSLVLVYLSPALETFFRVHGEDGKMRREQKFAARGTMSSWTGTAVSSVSEFTFGGLSLPPQTYQYNFSTNTIMTRSNYNLPFDFSKVKMELRTFKSADGTLVPLHIYSRAGKTEHSFAYLFVYGGFGISNLSQFSQRFLLALEMGGVVAILNSRGGTEFGDKWHYDAIGHKKMKTLEDVKGAADWLTKEYPIKGKRVVLYGRSNGGMIAASALSLWPELFAVAFPAYPLTDLVRYSRLSPSAYRWLEENGDRGVSSSLLKFSALHNLSEKKTYPPTLVFTAENDDRVGVAHAYKYTAALQDLSPAATYLWQQPKAGHFFRGEFIDELTFIGKTLGISTLDPMN